jgi:hypothetical protein
MSTNPSQSMQGMFGQLSLGSRVAGGSAIVLFISCFLEWVHASVSIGALSVSSGASGFSEYFFGKLAALAAVLVIVALVMEVRGASNPLPWPPSLMIMALGGIAFISAAFHIFSYPGGLSGASGAGIDIGASFGVYLATLAAIGVAAGGYLKLKD